LRSAIFCLRQFASVAGALPALGFGVLRVGLCPVGPKQKAALSDGLFHHQRQRAHLVAALRFAGALLFAGVFARAAWAAVFRFAGVLLFAGVFACAAWAAVFRFAGALLFAGVFVCAALAAFFVVFAIVITSIVLLKLKVRIDVNHNEWLFG
jgi:hypothetical protein